MRIYNELSVTHPMGGQEDEKTRPLCSQEMLSSVEEAAPVRG